MSMGICLLLVCHMILPFDFFLHYSEDNIPFHRQYFLFKSSCLQKYACIGNHSLSLSILRHYWLFSLPYHMKFDFVWLSRALVHPIFVWLSDDRDYKVIKFIKMTLPRIIKFTVHVRPEQSCQCHNHQGNISS